MSNRVVIVPASDKRGSNPMAASVTATTKLNKNKNSSNKKSSSSIIIWPKINKIQQIKILILLLFGILLAICSFLSHIYLPNYLQSAILREYMLDPNSVSYANWKKTNIPIYSSYYLFNVTNSDELFNNGNIKPILQQVGPYVFEQVFEKINISWTPENGTVQYRQVKRWIPVPSLTNGSLDDIIVHINVPLMSAVYQVQMAPKEEQYLAYESLNSMIDVFKIPIFMKHTVNELLFEGYEDDLLTTAASFYPTQVSQTRFGFLYQKNNTSTDGLFRIFTGQQDYGTKLGLIDTWNNEPVLTKWNKGDKCRSFDKTTTGDLLPPFFIKQNYHLLKYFGQDNLLKPEPKIRMFIADMCRTFELEYTEPIVNSGLNGYRYKMDPMTFNYTFEENRCYCNNTCPPNGLFNLGVCAQDSPIFTSSPHFLFADDDVQNSVVGLSPDPLKHQFVMDFDKKFGVAMNVDVKFQLNLFVEKRNEIELMENWPDDLKLYFPQFWFTTHAEIDESIKSQIYFISEILPVILVMIIIIMALISISCFVYLIIYCMTLRHFVSSWSLNTDGAEYESVSMLETKSNN